jgi:hypothetical protein
MSPSVQRVIEELPVVRPLLKCYYECNMPAWKILCVIFVMMGVVSMGVGAGYYIKDRTPNNYTHTSGVVSQITRVYAPYKICGRYGCHTYPAYRYNADITFKVNGHPYIFAENLGGQGVNDYKVDQTVDVAYNPSEPSDRPIDSSNQLNRGVAQIFAIIGGLLFVTGALILKLKH